MRLFAGACGLDRHRRRRNPGFELRDDRTAHRPRNHVALANGRRRETLQVGQPSNGHSTLLWDAGAY